MKADVLTNISYLTNYQADTTTIPTLYDEVVYDLGASPWMTDVAFLANNNSGTLGLVTWPAAATTMYSMIYGGRHIGELGLREVEYLYPDWRITPGRPRAYVTDEQDRGDFQLVPTPQYPTQMPIGPQMQSLPDDVVVMFYSGYRTDVIRWLEWPVAFMTIAREFGRDSDHTNPDLAMAGMTLGALMLHMLQ